MRLYNYLQQFLYSSIRQLTYINAAVVVDGSGNQLPLDEYTQGNLIASVEHLGTGQYRLHLKNTFNALVGLNATPVSQSGGVTSGIVCELDPNTSNISDNADPHVDINCFNPASGALQNPASGSGFLVTIMASSSSVKQ